jgi:chromosome segregation and condensation protein ScpB
MKNKVDISKVIEEKYKDKSNRSLQLEDILREIDLALQESDQSFYTSKVVRNGVSDALPEENKTPYGTAALSMKGGRNPLGTGHGYKGKKPDAVIAHNIAEAPQAPLSNVRQRTIKIPDLFSKITDPKGMTVGAEDRKLINNIMANIGLQETVSWRQRVAKLQNHINSIKNYDEAKKQNNDITELISGLIFVNLFKKLAFFMDQSNKQFEYLFLPFLDPKAEIRGSEQEELIDIVSDGQEYSVKFIKSQQPSIRGSRELLYVKQEGSAMYLVCRVIPGKNIIEFAEFLVSIDDSIVTKEGYHPIESSEKATSVWLRANSAGGPQFVCLVDTTPETVRQIYQKANIEPPEQIKREKEQVEKSTIGGLDLAPKDIETLNKNLNTLTAEITRFKELFTKINKAQQEFDKKPTEINNVLLNKAKKEVEELFRKDNIQNLFTYFNQFPAFQENVNVKSLNEFVTSLKQLEDFISSIRNDIKNKNTKLQEAEEKQKLQSSGQFQFPIQGVWETIKMKNISINFGSMEEYGQMTGYINGAINNFYVDLLDNLDNLTENVTNFVATSADTQRSTGSQTYALKSMKNAQDIKDNILDIRKGQVK